MKKILKIIGLISAVIISILFILLLSVYILLQSDYGRNKLTQLVNEVANTDTFKLELDGLSGRLPGDIRLKSVRISDSIGVWLSADELSLQWDWSRLLFADIHINSLRLNRLTIDRYPSGSDEETDSSIESIILPAGKIERLVVGDITLPPVSDRPLENLSLTGSVETRIRSASLNAVIEEKSGLDRASVSASFHFSTLELNVKTDIQENPGGFLASFVPVKPSNTIHLTLNGNGPLTDWNGALKLVAPGLADTEIDFNTTFNETYGLKTRGVISLDEQIIPGEINGITGRSAGFDIAASTRDFVKIDISDLSVKTDKIELDLNGDIDLGSAEFNLAAVLSSPEFKYLEDAYKVELCSLTKLDLKANGTFTNPAVQLHTRLASVEAAGFSAENPELSADISAKFDPEYKLEYATAEGNISLDEFIAPHVELPPQKLKLYFNINTPDLSRLNVEGLNLDNSIIEMSSKGFVNISTSDFSASGNIGLPSTAELKPLTTLDLNASARFQYEVKGSWNQPDIRTKLDGVIENIKGLPSELLVLTGDKASLSAEAEYKPGLVEVKNLNFHGASDFQTSGKIGVSDNTIDVYWKTKLDSADKLLKRYGLALTGSPSAEGRLTGKLTSPTAKADIHINLLQKEKLKLSNINLKTTLNTGPSLAADLKIEAQCDKGPLKAQLDMKQSAKEFVFDTLKINAPGVDISGKLRYFIKNQILSGDLAFVSKDLSSLPLPIDSSISGAMTGRFLLSDKKGKQGAEAEFHLKSAGFENLTVRSCDMTASFLDWKIDRPVQANIALQDFTYSDVKIKQGTLSAKTRDGKTFFSSQASGKSIKDFKINLSGDIADAKSENIYNINKLSGRFGNYPIQLTTPLQIAHGSRSFRFDAVDLKIAGGTLKGYGKISGETAKIKITADDLPLSPLNLFIPLNIRGLIDAELDVSGSAKSPVVTLKSELVNLQPGYKATSSRPALNADLSISIAKGSLRGLATLKGLGEKPAEAEVDMPLSLSLTPLNASIVKTKKISGKLNGVVELGILPFLLRLDDQAINGKADARLSMGGTAASPVITGTILLSDGKYENLRSGTIIDKITGRLDADSKAVKITALTASDGEKGRITADGTLLLDADKGFPYTASAKVDKAKLARLDIFQAEADGSVKFEGNTSKAKLSGSLTLVPVEINIPDKSHSSVVNLEVEEINGPAKKPAVEKKSPDSGYELELDANLNLPQRMFIRGKGLDSEWQGALSIKGTTSNPVINGTLEIVRGRFEFLGRRFNLTTGSVSFSGSKPPKPVLNVVGESKANDITATVRLTGPVDALNVQLSSEPALPQDEVLARLLFGRSLSRISPIQALTLAQTAAELAGGPGAGTGFDIMGKTRKMLGLDQLNIKTGSEGGTAIGFGKYLNEYVYVEAEKGTKPGEDKVSVQVEITPSLTLESEVGTESNGGISINWKKDY